MRKLFVGIRSGIIVEILFGGLFLFGSFLVEFGRGDHFFSGAVFMKFAVGVAADFDAAQRYGFTFDLELGFRVEFEDTSSGFFLQ